VKVQYTGHLGYCPFHLVVHDHEGRELPADALLLSALGDAAIDLGGIVAPLLEALALDFGRRGHEQDDQCVGVPLPHLTRSLEVDLEDHVLVRRRFGERGAVEVPEELRPLQESAGGDLLLEGLAVDEGVGILGFTRASGSCRPRTTEPEPRVAFDQSGDDRAFPGPPGARDDEDQDFEVCVRRASR
jgi:hypothetical protein